MASSAVLASSFGMTVMAVSSAGQATTTLASGHAPAKSGSYATLIEA